MTDHSHEWANTHKISGWELSETCRCGAYCEIKFPPNGPPSRDIWPESAHQGIAGWTRQEALTDDEEAHYREILGL